MNLIFFVKSLPFSKTGGKVPWPVVQLSICRIWPGVLFLSIGMCYSKHSESAVWDSSFSSFLQRWSSYRPWVSRVLIMLDLPRLWIKPDKLWMSQIRCLCDLRVGACVWMSAALRDLELVFSTARAMLELKGVLVLLLFCLGVISELNQETHLWRPGRFPALRVKEYGSRGSAPYIEVLLCSVCLRVSACSGCVCVSWFCGLKQWLLGHPQGCCWFFFCLFCFFP